MVNYTSANVALYQLGASGDNLIPDGYVRTTEKVWMDYYTYSTASTALMTTADTLLIGYIPANKKVVGCEVVLPATFLPTGTTINVGPSYSTALFITSSTAYIGASQNVCRMNNPAGYLFICTSSTTSVSGGTILQNVNTPIYLSLGVTAITAPTAGTITTILRYT